MTSKNEAEHMCTLSISIVR